MQIATRILLGGLIGIFACLNVRAANAKAEFFVFDDFAGGIPLVVPLGISANGSTVVGISFSEIGGEAFIWTKTTGIRRMPESEFGYAYAARDASADGSVIVGTMQTPAGEQPFRWSEATGYSLIAPSVQNLNASAYGVSDDGEVVVIDGYSSTEPYQCFVWTSSLGVERLDDLPGGRNNCEVSDISADGSTIVGVSGSETGDEAFRWTRAAGMQGLGTLPASETGIGSGASAASADGSIIAGYSLSDGFTAIQATRWTTETGMLGIGERLPGSHYWSQAKDITADGSLIVGQDYVNGAFLWDETNGLRSLQDVLINRFDLSEEIGSFHLSSAEAVSADGRVITGFGGGGFSKAWVAIVPEPSTSVLGVITIFLGALAARARSRDVNPAGQAPQSRHRRTLANDSVPS